MVNQIDVMRNREEAIAELIDTVSRRSRNFTEPPITTIGGYALRAFVPYSRYTRDCDFVLPRGRDWVIDTVSQWFADDLKVEALEKHETYGYLRMMRPFKMGGKSANVAIDFMEGEVRGRTDEQVIVIDREFIARRRKVGLRIGSKRIEMFVPNYADYFILKVVSGRSSDVRDIAALVWKNGVPEGLEERVKEIVPTPEFFRLQLSATVIPDISDRRFVDSFRGTFITAEFDESAKGDVLIKINDLLREWPRRE